MTGSEDLVETPPVNTQIMPRIWITKSYSQRIGVASRDMSLRTRTEVIQRLLLMRED